MSQNPVQQAAPALRRLRFWTRAALLAETLLPRVGPALLVLLAYAAIALLGGLADLPGWARDLAFSVVMLASVALLTFGLRQLPLPSPDATDRRLETQSGLLHQPLRTLSDAASTGSGELWALHLAAARAQLARLRLRWPRPVVAMADPMAIRALVLLLLAAGFGVAGTDSLPRLAAAFTPHFDLLPHTPPPLLQAWIAMPGYTGLPPLVLKPEGGNASVPEGSIFTASLSTEGRPPVLSVDGTSHDFTHLDATGYQASASLTASAHVAIRDGQRDLTTWSITVEPDEAPLVNFPEPPGGAVQGNAVETRLPWHVAHRYGVAELHANLTLADRPNAPALSVPIPLGGTPKEAKGAERVDLAAHPWAGLAVIATLSAKDVAGHMAQSDVQRFVLPERRFRNAMARAVIAVRRQLSLTPNETDHAAETFDALAENQEFWEDDPSGYLNLAAITALLRHGVTPVDEAQSRMWELALHLEEGAPDRTERALEAARRDMHQALDEARAADPQEQTDAPHKAEALAEALRQRLDALSQAARRDPDSQAYNPDAHPKDRREMQQLTDALREATKQGKREIARDLMAELDRKLDALKGQRAERKQGDTAQTEKRRQGKRQMNVLQEMVQREGQLLDHSQFRPYDFDQKPTDAQNAHAADHAVQLALRRVLGLLMQQYGDLSGSVPPHLGKADMAMRDAAQALAQGHDMTAAAAQQAVIEALQQGGRDMKQQMSQQFGQSQDDGNDPSSAQNGDDDDGDGSGAMADGEGDDENGMGNDPSQGQNGQRPGQQGRKHADRQGRDPLGRPRGDGTGGLEDDGETAVPEQMEQARTRALQEELRRRSADRTRQLEELQYIDRLLKQF